MDKQFNIKNADSEDLIKMYEKINTFIKFLDSEKEKTSKEVEDG